MCRAANQASARRSFAKRSKVARRSATEAVAPRSRCVSPVLGVTGGHFNPSHLMVARPGASAHATTAPNPRIISAGSSRWRTGQCVTAMMGEWPCLAAAPSLGTAIPMVLAASLRPAAPHRIHELRLCRHSVCRPQAFSAHAGPRGPHVWPTRLTSGSTCSHHGAIATTVRGQTTGLRGVGFGPNREARFCALATEATRPPHPPMLQGHLMRWRPTQAQ